MHVLHTFANNDHVPYLTWFAQRAKTEGDPHYTFLIMFPVRPRMIDEMRAMGYNCEWIPFRDTHRKSDMLRALPKLVRLIRKYRPDVVHCNLFDDSLPGIIAAKLAGSKVRVVTKQDTGYHYMHAPRWIHFDKLISRLATHVIAISHECERFLIEVEGTPAQKITMVHNGIPPADFTRQDPMAMQQLKTRFGLGSNAPIIGTVARFIEWKGYRHIVEAACIIVQKVPNARFLFCGNGQQENEIRSLVQEAGLNEHVVFTGWVDRAEMASFYGLLDVYLHAAVLEPFGLVYAEAMLNGVPVVSTSTGAAADAITSGQNGILVPERTGKALAEGVEQLLASDPKAVGEAGRRTATNMYTFDQMWTGTTQLYRKALGEE